MSVYIGPSEAQSAADANGRRVRAEVRHRERSDRERRDDDRTVASQREAWSRTRRERLRTDPPTQLPALLAWFQHEYELALPDALHSGAIWFDTVTGQERAEGARPVGGSMIGSLAYDPKFRGRIEGSPHAKDHEGDLLSPFVSAFAALRRQRPRTVDLLEYVARNGFDWQAVVGRPFYARSRIPPHPRVLVMALPDDVLRAVLQFGLTELWTETRDRMPVLGAGE